METCQQTAGQQTVGESNGSQQGGSQQTAGSSREPACWEMRGCDEEMQSRCPHNTPGEPCPAGCHYAACHRKTHVVARDINVMLNPELDYDRGIKEVCHICEYFLKRGPLLSERPPDFVPRKSQNRFLL